MKSFSNRFLKIFVEYKLIMIEHDFYKFQSMKVETNNIEDSTRVKHRGSFMTKKNFAFSLLRSYLHSRYDHVTSN